MLHGGGPGMSTFLSCCLAGAGGVGQSGVFQLAAAVGMYVAVLSLVLGFDSFLQLVLGSLCCC